MEPEPPVFSSPGHKREVQHKAQGSAPTQKDRRTLTDDSQRLLLTKQDKDRHVTTV